MSFSEWKKVKIKDVTTKIGSGSTPRGGASVYQASGTAFVRSQNIYNNYFDYSGLVYIDDTAANKLKGVALYSNDVLLNITGDSVARCTIVPDQVLPARVNQHVCIIRADEAKLDYRFLKYALVNPTMQELMLSYAQAGGTRAALTKVMVEEFEINLPPIQEQKAIANILSSLDEKIELNNQMNKTLEEMAQALFKRWFVDFEFPNEEGEPYKSSGGEMVDSELGMIPKGWESIKLGDSDIEIEDGDRGKNYPNKAQLQPQGDVAFLNNKNIVGDKINFIETEYINRERDLLLRKGKIKINDIILTTRGSVGNIGLFHKFLPCEEARINSGMVIIRNKEMFNLYFLYQQLKDKTLKEQYKKMATGSAQPQLPIKDIKKLTLLIPKEHIQEKFETVVKCLYKTIFKNDKENYSLINVRNNLLPKLMSGELRVTDLQN